MNNHLAFIQQLEKLVFLQDLESGHLRMMVKFQKETIKSLYWGLALLFLIDIALYLALFSGVCA